MSLNAPVCLLRIPLVALLMLLSLQGRVAHAATALHHQHRIVFQVDADDANAMGHAISGSINATRYYTERGETVAIEIVANGKGVSMFRSDVSPVLNGLALVHELAPQVVFSVCGSTKQVVEAREGHAMPLVKGTHVVPFGISRIVELEEAGWSYIHA